MASSALAPDTLMSLMALVFVRLHFRDRLNLPHRTSISTGAYSVLFMPAHLEGFGTTIKTVSIPGAHGTGGVQATTLVLDEQSGAVRAIINATGLTALRTAAGSVLATRLIGPAAPRVLLVFGAGGQIAAHVDLVLRTLHSIDRCIIVNRARNPRLEVLLTSLQNRFLHVLFSSEDLGTIDLETIVTSADIICTATSSTKPLFKSAWVKTGAHINMVGSYTPAMAEVESELLKRAGKILVDSKEACLAEAGEIIRAGLTPEALVEVGEVVEHDGKGIPDAVNTVKEAGDVTIFKSVGVGLQDTIIATTVLEKAISMGLGTQIAAYD